jgi:acyl carrier protein
MDRNRQEILQRLKPLLREALPDVDLESIGPESTAADLMGWNSVAHVTLMTEVEETFAIMFTPDELTQFSNIGDLVSLIAEKMNAAG